MSQSKDAASLRACTMRKLIRSLATKEFLTQNGAWTNDIGSAAIFSDHDAALDAKKRYNLQGVQIYYSFDDERASQFDFGLAL